MKKKQKQKRKKGQRYGEREIFVGFSVQKILLLAAKTPLKEQHDNQRKEDVYIFSESTLQYDFKALMMICTKEEEDDDSSRAVHFSHALLFSNLSLSHKPTTREER